MGKVLLGIIAVVASFMLVESNLTCNQCSFGLVGFCVIPKQQSCSLNTSVCYTALATFPSVSTFNGFNTQGCLDNTSSCNTTTTASFLTVNYTSQITCCSSNNCNPVQFSSAGTTSVTITATIGAAVLASVWGSML